MVSKVAAEVAALKLATEASQDKLQQLKSTQDDFVSKVAEVDAQHQQAEAALHEVCLVRYDGTAPFTAVSRVTPACPRLTRRPHPCHGMTNKYGSQCAPYAADWTPNLCNVCHLHHHRS